MNIWQILVIIFLVASFIKSMIMGFLRIVSGTDDSGIFIGMVCLFFFKCFTYGILVTLLILGGFFK